METPTPLVIVPYTAYQSCVRPCTRPRDSAVRPQGMDPTCRRGPAPHPTLHYIGAACRELNLTCAHTFLSSFTPRSLNASRCLLSPTSCIGRHFTMCGCRVLHSRAGPHTSAIAVRKPRRLPAPGLWNSIPVSLLAKHQAWVQTMCRHTHRVRARLCACPRLATILATVVMHSPTKSWRDKSFTPLASLSYTSNLICNRQKIRGCVSKL